jgi:hypothetical protein
MNAMPYRVWPANALAVRRPRAFLRLLRNVALTMSLLSTAHGQQESPVALATEVTGKAETQVHGKPAAVVLLSEFAPGARVRLHRNATMVVLYLRSAEQFSLAGPALVRFGQSAPEALSGNEPTRLRAVAGRDGKPVTIRPGGVTQAAIVVRGLSKPIPAAGLAGGVTLELRPTFRWQDVAPGLEYQFTLRDAQDSVLFSRKVNATALELPGEHSLAEGKRYRWSVAAKAADGTVYASSYRFTVADARLRAEADNFQPPSGAPPRERLVYALWLEQAGLGDEAARHWQQLTEAGVARPGAKPDTH